MANGNKTGGRKAGTPNKATLEGREFVDRVRRRLLKQHKLSLEAISVELLGPKTPPAIRQRELQQLREYEYGRSVQPIVSSDAAGLPTFVFTPDGRVSRLLPQSKTVQ